MRIFLEFKRQNQIITLLSILSFNVENRLFINKMATRISVAQSKSLLNLLSTVMEEVLKYFTEVKLLIPQCVLKVKVLHSKCYCTC